MGFELTKLMRQYGVSTPSIAAYTGSVAGAKPTDETAADYAAQLATYNKSVEQEKADRAAYDKYVSDYQSRMAGTPMYSDKQFQPIAGTRPTFAPTYSGAYNWNRDVTNPTAVAAGGVDRMNQNLVNWFKRNPDATGADVRSMLRKYEISENDVRNAMGLGFQYGEAGPGGKSGYVTGDVGQMPKTGSYWGDQLKAPTYASVGTTTAPTAQNQCQPGFHWDYNAGACVADNPTCPDGFYYDPATKSCQPIGDGMQNKPTQPTGPSTQTAGTTAQPFAPNPFFPTLEQQAQVMQYSHGGGVKTHYYDGGRPQVSGDPNDISSIYGEDLPSVTLPAPAAAAAPAPSSEDPLMAMLSKYAAPGSSYGAELGAARQKVTEQSQAFNDMMKKFLTEKEEPMSQSEKYFRLAAAFGAPTKTGNFFEALGNVSKEAGEQKKEERISAREKKQLALQLGLKGAEMGLTGAKEDLATLRTLSAQEMKDKNDLVKEAMKEYIASGKPKSEAGKMAQDLGLKPGTDEYNKKVNEIVSSKLEAEQARMLATTANMSIAQANLALAQGKAAQLSPKEVDLKNESEEKLQALRNVESTLRQAFAVNDKTFDGTLVQSAQKKFLENFDSEDPRVVATRTQANLLSQSAVGKLRESFGGNPTEGERAILLALEGIDAKSKAERKAIMLQAWGKLQNAMEFRQKKLNEIASGLYRNVQSPQELK